MGFRQRRCPPKWGGPVGPARNPRGPPPGAGIPSLDGLTSAYTQSVAIFEQFDENGDGLISREELSKVFVALDPEHWTERRLGQLMAAADTNNDGYIHYEEFVKWLMQDTAEWEVDRAAIALRRRPSMNRRSLVVDSRQTVRRTEPLVLQVDQSGGETLGVKVDSSDECTLLIKSIKDDGLLARWNSSNRDKQVNIGDRIVDVNDMHDDANRIMKELKKKLVLDITVQPSEAATNYVSKITDVFEVEPTWMEKGAYSCIKRSVNRETKAVYVVKSMHKQHTTKEQLDTMTDILKEIDHPNVLKLYEVYEDCLDFHLVTELCSGGQLFERVLQDNFFTERQAINIMVQILTGVAYLHSKSICHRNLRPEHVLMETDKPIANCVVKLTDFRSARRFAHGGGLFRTRVGQVLYMPPEMARREAYDHSCDIWSCGVMLYLAISGYPPFAGENDFETLRLVQQANVVFPEYDWRNVSKGAQDLVRSLMSYRPGDRPSAAQACNHPWIKNPDLEGKPFPLHSCQAMLHNYCGQSKLKKVALQAIAHRLRYDDIQQLYDMFALLDKNGDKLVTFYELKEGLDKLGHAESTQSLKALMEEIDIDGSRQINYTEFLAATLDRKRYRESDACWAAFQVFDRDRSGRISKQELGQVLSSEGIQAVMDAADIERVLQECDADHDGSIDFEEFMAMMRQDGPRNTEEEL